MTKATLPGDPHAQIWSAIRQLSEEQRKVILLYYFQNQCSVEQLAEWLEIPPSIVRDRLECARRALKNSLGSRYNVKIERALAPYRPDKKFTRKVMAALPLVLWKRR